jgi:capsular polysaccharide transport system permease protein
VNALPENFSALSEAATAADDHIENLPKRRVRLWTALRRSAWLYFILLVLVPTTGVLYYQNTIATPKYKSEGQFIVRGIQPDQPQVGSLGQLLGVGQGLGGTQKEAQAIREYLMSADAVIALKSRNIDIRTLLYPANLDPVERWWLEDDKAESFLELYRRHVQVDYDPEDGISRLSVTAYNPNSTRMIADALIALGEERVNQLNARAISAGTDNSVADFKRAENDLEAIQKALTAFRDITGEIDPLRKSEGTQRLENEQEILLTRERALLADMSRYLDADAPQVIAVRSRIATLEAVVRQSETKLTGSPEALNKKLAQYEALKLKQQFAAKRYETARSAMEAAQTQVVKQQIFIVPVVQPSLPERSISPRPLRSTLTAFMILVALFGIGWLLLAGVREHRA